jgi:hypothetical protein
MQGIDLLMYPDWSWNGQRVQWHMVEIWIPVAKTGKFNTESRPALISMLEISTWYYWIIKHFFSKSLITHIIFDLAWLLKTGKNSKLCRIATGELWKSGWKKTWFSFVVYLLVISFTSFGTPHLQLEIHPHWQMPAFRVSNSSGNGISETGYL